MHTEETGLFYAEIKKIQKEAWNQDMSQKKDAEMMN